MVSPATNLSITLRRLACAGKMYSPARSRPWSSLMRTAARNASRSRTTPASASACEIARAPLPCSMNTVVDSSRGPGREYSCHPHPATPAAKQTARKKSRASRRTGRFPLRRRREDQAGVGSAKAEGVRHHRPERLLLRLMRHEVEVATLRRVLEIERRRYHAITQRQDREDRFGTAGCAEQVADRGFGRRHREVIGMLAEQPLHRSQLDFVAERRRSAVRIHVPDILGIEPGSPQ